MLTRSQLLLSSVRWLPKDDSSRMSTPADPSPTAPGGSTTASSPTRIKEIGGFEILNKLGQGGMGAVYKARQKSLDRIVALKVLPPSIAKDAVFIERFQREARASAKLNHPNIVRGIDVGRDAATGLWYFAMEYIDGSTLKKVLDEQKIVTEERALGIIRQIALALEIVNTAGMVHRDIKPDNILLTKEGEAKLADLGLVKQVKTEDASLTQSGQAVGTPFYMAPEQVRGAAAEIDIRTDIYALGGTLFHLVVGAPPYTGLTTAAIMSLHLTDPVPNARKANPGISEACSRLIEKMMQKKREQRVQTPAELLTLIDKASKGEVATGLRPATSIRQYIGAKPTSKYKKLLHSASGVAALVVLMMALKWTGKFERFANTDPRTAPLTTAALSHAETRAAATPNPTTAQAMSAHVAKTGASDVVGSGTAIGPGADGKKPDVLPSVAEHDSTAKPSVAKVKVPESKVAVAPLVAETVPPVPPVDAAKDLKVPGPENDPVKAVAPVAVAPVKKTYMGPEAAVLVAKAVTLANESHFDEAANVFKLPAAKMDQFDEFDREVVTQHAECYAGLPEMKQTILERLKRDPEKVESDRVFLTKRLGGKMAGGDAKNLHIRQGSQLEVSYKWQLLSIQELSNLTEESVGVVPLKTSLALGLYAFDRGEDSIARKILEGPAHASPSARKIMEQIDARDQAAIQKRAQDNAAMAEKLFGDIELALNEMKFPIVLADATVLKTKYADTESVKRRAAEIEAWIEAARCAQSGMAVMPGNVALATKGATVTGPTSNAAGLIDGIVTGYTGGTGFAMGSFPCEWTVTLPKPYLLREIRMLLWDNADRYYRYQIETSVDGNTFNMLADHSKGQYRSWQTISFAPRPVKAIRVKGLYNSANGGFHVVELEAYCIPPEQPAKAKFAKPAAE